MATQPTAQHTPLPGDIAQLSAIRDAALAMSKRSNISASYRQDLIHIASDADWAMEGCKASLASVVAFVERDHELAIAASQHRRFRGCAVEPVPVSPLRASIALSQGEAA